MNADIFAEWLRRQGHCVIRTASSYWYDQGPRTYQAFPYHWVIQPHNDELSNFLVENKALGLRYSAPLSSDEGHISYHAIYDRPTYDIDGLGKWARKNVRRGLKNCVIEPISFERLADEGWALQLDTLARQGRHLKVSQDVWRVRCLAAKDLYGFEAWGALVQNKLAASVITFQMDDCCYMLYQQCQHEFLDAHVNNALGFIVTQTIINRPTIKSILYGLHSLDAPASVDEFKFRMGYTAKPVRQRVVFHPFVAPAINPINHKIARIALQITPGQPTLAKAEGMMRFYLEGKYPLEKQPWPEPLSQPAQSED